MPDAPSHNGELSRLEVDDLIQAASRIAGFEFDQEPEFASAANVSGLRLGTRVFSRRHDSHTMFASDESYGIGRELGVWAGADERLDAACRRVLRAAGVPAAELAGVDVISEYGAAGQRVSDAEIRIEEPTLLRKLARARRALDELPVWSSHAIVGLTAKGQIGRLEVHWPHLSPAVVKEANLLRALVERGFKPPALPGARTESVEAGILHSPAIGFFMEITPAVRVVYIGDDRTVGRKPTLYLDRHGEGVPLPREIRQTDVERKERPEPISRTVA